MIATRRTALILLASGAAGLLAGCNAGKILTTDEGTASDHTEASLALVNALRRERGLPPLVADKAARDAALAQARRMAAAGEMSHLIGFNDSFLSRMKGSKVALPAAENISAGQDDAQAAFRAWHDSRKHLENMLGTYRGLGVAVAQNASSANRPYWAMVLSG